MSFNTTTGATATANLLGTWIEYGVNTTVGTFDAQQG